MIWKMFVCVPKITQDFGKKLYIDGVDYYAKFGLSGHNGIDFVCDDPTIISPWDAQVINVGDQGDKGYGKFVVLWHKPLNLATWYCHLDKSFVMVNDELEAGDLIGRMGNTGMSTNTHLHFALAEVDNACNRKNWNNGYKGFINPMTVFMGGLND